MLQLILAKKQTLPEHVVSAADDDATDAPSAEPSLLPSVMTPHVCVVV